MSRDATTFDYGSAQLVLWITGFDWVTTTIYNLFENITSQAPHLHSLFKLYAFVQSNCVNLHFRKCILHSFTGIYDYSTKYIVFDLMLYPTT